MLYDDEQLFANVKGYCQGRRIDVERQDSLGHGSDGAVWKTSVPSAVKSFYKEANFEIELECYRRLKEGKVHKILGLNVPVLEGYDGMLRVIEMSFVEPPYILDFGKAIVDSQRIEYQDPQFLANAVHAWQADFGEHWNQVAGVIYHLRNKYGILYVDPRRGNINLGDDNDDDWQAEPGIDYSSYE